MTDAVGAVDELSWLHAHEYTPWGVHVAAAQEHPSNHSVAGHYGMSGARAALVNGHLAVVVEGRGHRIDQISSTCRLDLFDLEQEKWLTGFDIKGELLRRVGHTVVSMDTKRAVIFGGESLALDDEMTCLNDCYELTFDQSVLHCKPLTFVETPCERAWHSATAVTMLAPGSAIRTEAMLVMGGKDASSAMTFLSDQWVLQFDLPGEPPKWTQLTPTGSSPLPLAYHSTVAVDQGEKVVVVGGRPSARGAMAEGVSVLDITANTWSQLAMPDTNPCGWTARSCLTVLSVYVPVEDASGRLAQIKTPKQASTGDSSAELEEGGVDGTPSFSSSPSGAWKILIFGGFSARAPVSDPSRFALLDKATGVLREVRAPSLGLTTYMSQASVASADAKSVYIFGGIDAKNQQPVDATNGIHFWKPQPMGCGEHGDDSGESNNDVNAIHTKVYDNGDEYTGQMDPQKLLRHGQGRCVYHDGGAVYEGDWQDDKRCGQGVLSQPSGATYTGQWVNDMRHGYGIHETKPPADFAASQQQRSETRYDGQWENDRKTGSGSVTFSDGSILKGSWVGGALVSQMCRLESYDDGNGVATYTGEVAAGLPHGHGESQHLKETYVGNWLHGRRSGHGVSTLFDGTTYTGDWKNGKKNGFGKCVYVRTRDQYDGKWVGGVRCGRGVCRYANGSQYDGEWKDDKCHGTGRFTFLDGTFYEGNWKENKFCGDGALVLDLNEPSAAPQE